MKRFIARKKYKLPRYKIILGKLFIIIIIFIFINIFINKNKDFIYNILSINSFNIIKLNNKYNNFSRYILGFNITKTKEVSSNNNQFEKLEITNDKPIIYIYSTHQTDKYKMNYFNSYSINWTILDASQILKEYLKKENISSYLEVERVAKVLQENNTDYSYSYRGSRILLEKAYQTYPSLEYFFDLGISSSSYEQTTTSIANKNYAKILWVIGTEYPTYIENEKFAITLDNLLKKYDPNLSRGIERRGNGTYHGVYNQDFNTHTLLLYIGGKDNTIDEVNRTLKVLSEVFKEYLEEQNGKT